MVSLTVARYASLMAFERDSGEQSELAPPYLQLARRFERVHGLMRDGDGLQPQDALDELVKILFALGQGNRQRAAAGVPAAPVKRQSLHTIKITAFGNKSSLRAVIFCAYPIKADKSPLISIPIYLLSPEYPAACQNPP